MSIHDEIISKLENLIGEMLTKLTYELRTGYRPEALESLSDSIVQLMEARCHAYHVKLIAAPGKKSGEEWKE